MWNQSQLQSGLLVDLYHIDAAYIAWRSGLNGPATFDLYTRQAPFGGSYLLSAGQELAICFASNFHFKDDDIAFLRSVRPYDEAFLQALNDLSFAGEILAFPEGEIAFPGEPLLRVSAPFIEALMLESGLLHTIGVSTLLATKASRIVQSAAGRSVAEFGFRRAHEPYLAARSSYIGGFDSTSFLAAARAFAMPASGTIPHALIEAFATEEEAFRAVADTLPRYSLLLDTYDVERAIHTAVSVARDALQRTGNTLTAVRLDSGDLVADSRYVRKVLDQANLRDVRILASGDLDEWRIATMVREDAPIDGFGVGTSLAVGAGSAERGIPGGALGAVYKLVWYEGSGSPARIKIAGDKSTWPGRKQVIRSRDFTFDLVQLEHEPIPSDSAPMLSPAVVDGEALVTDDAPLEIARERARRSLASFPRVYRDLDEPEPFPVEWSAELSEMRRIAIELHGAA